MIIRRLRESVAVLASSAEDQVYWLNRERCPVDELALQFDDCLEAALATKKFGHGLVENLRCLDVELDTMSGANNGDLWTENAVRNDSRWDAIRRTAQRVLTQEPWPTDVGE